VIWVIGVHREELWPKDYGTVIPQERCCYLTGIAPPHALPPRHGAS
jgi:hypothetical protein